MKPSVTSGASLKVGVNTPYGLTLKDLIVPKKFRPKILGGSKFLNFKPLPSDQSLGIDIYLLLVYRGEEYFCSYYDVRMCSCI